MHNAITLSLPFAEITFEQSASSKANYCILKQPILHRSGGGLYYFAMEHHFWNAMWVTRHGQTVTTQTCPFLFSPRAAIPSLRIHSTVSVMPSSSCCYIWREIPCKDTVLKQQDPFNPSCSSCTTTSPCALRLVHIWLQMVSKLSKLIQQKVFPLPAILNCL